MKGPSKDALDQKILTYAKAKKTICVNEVARHFKVRWDRARRSVLRLTASGKLFYHADMGKNPKFYSIWPDTIPFCQPDIQKCDSEAETNEYYARTIAEWCRADHPEQIIEKGGFVCHPSLRGRDVPETFVRGHLHGQYVVEVKTVGSMPETFVVSGSSVTGGWMRRKMSGNACYYGHLFIPSDPQKFRFHAMTNKAGEVRNLSVYVHPRFIYYKSSCGRGSSETAYREFEQQVSDILEVLTIYGWQFGEIQRKGIYSMGLNNREFAQLMPTNHVELESDPVKFDSSPGNSDAGCTEAEILCDHPSAEMEHIALVEAPVRIIALEGKMDVQSKRIATMNDKIDSLIGLAEKSIQLTEMTMVGATSSIQQKDIVTAMGNKEDVMYG